MMLNFYANIYDNFITFVGVIPIFKDIHKNNYNIFLECKATLSISTFLRLKLFVYFKSHNAKWSGYIFLSRVNYNCISV